MSTLNLSDYVQLARASRLAETLRWIEDGDGTPQPAGDVGGDAQLDFASLSRAWWAELPGGLFARIEVAYYIGEAPERQHDSGSPIVAEELRTLQSQIEYLICRDRNDPGGTEAASEYVTWDNVRPDLRPIDANVRDLVLELDVDVISWPVHEPRVLRLLTHALPPVTGVTRLTGGSMQRLHIGRVPIGSIAVAETDAGARYVACAHDWDNGGPRPQMMSDVAPGPEYDPMVIGTYQDASEALREVITRAPADLVHDVVITNTEARQAEDART